MLTDENNPNLGHPVAVGLFPQGLTPGTGIHDLSGNVWEWTLSRWQDYPYAPSEAVRQQRNNPEGTDTRVVRGGYFDRPRVGRCASRDLDGAPGIDWFSNLGFRVVVSLVNSEFFWLYLSRDSRTPDGIPRTPHAV
jgi:formylglycine-generating enzyme required for sulfatase activity